METAKTQDADNEIRELKKRIKELESERDRARAQAFDFQQEVARLESRVDHYRHLENERRIATYGDDI